MNGLFNSMTLGVGSSARRLEWCSARNRPSFAQFSKQLAELVEKGSAATMLHPSILKGLFAERAASLASQKASSAVCRTAERSDERTEATPVLFETQGQVWLENPELAEEIFGPSAVLVRSQSKEEILRMARNWTGTLTASIFGTPEDLTEYKELISILEDKAGRIIFNGFPDRRRSDARHASRRAVSGDHRSRIHQCRHASHPAFSAPRCFQNFPDASLPPELQNANPRNMWRLVNGTLSKDPLS